MGLQNVAKNVAKAGFNVAGDIKRTVTFVEVIGTSYDPDTGETTGSTNTETVSGILSDYSVYEVANNIAQAEDKRLKIQQADVSIEPSVIDRVEIDGVAHQIVRWNQDTARTIYTLQLRK